MRSTVPAYVRLEMALVPAPIQFNCSGRMMEIDGDGHNVAVIELQVVSGNSIISREIVAIVGSDKNRGTHGMLNVIEYLRKKGEVLLHPDLGGERNPL